MIEDRDGTPWFSADEGASDPLRALPDDLRREFESECERLESRFREEKPALSEILADVRAEPPLRRLVLTHVGKLWLEAERQDGRTPDVEIFLAAVPELQSSRFARSELERWNRQLAGEKAATGTPLDIHGKTFLLPEEYELVERIQDQSNRMCLVLLVRNKRLKRLEVLKAINPARRTDVESIRRFLEEPVRASRTNHHAIVRVLSASQPDIEHPYYTMEYLEGGSLHGLLKPGPLPQLQAARYLAIVARALHHVHTTLGIAHGDLKPENILLDREGNPKLTDFGLSRSITPEAGPSFAEGHETGGVSGTVGYIAPEMLDSRYRTAGLDIQSLRIASDLFALGATLYCCLTCQLPYQPDRSKLSLFGAISNELTPVGQHVPGIDTKLQAICHKLLQLRPEHRFRSAAELADALEAWLSHQTLDQPGLKDITFPEPVKMADDNDRVVGRWKRPRVWLTLAAGAAVAAFVLIYQQIVGSTDEVPLRPDPPIGAKPGPGPEVKQPRVPTKPQTTPSSPVEMLIHRGWRRDAADAVVKLNEPWLAAVAEKKPDHVRAQLLQLSRLGESGVPLDSCIEAPHLAAMMSILVTPDEHKALTEVLRSSTADDPGLVVRLFTFYPSAGEAPSLLRLLREERPLLADLSRHGSFGPEIALLRSGSTDGDRTYQTWLELIVRERLIPGESSRSRKQASEFQAYMMIQGQSIRVRLSRDPEFRARFVGEIWPAFDGLVQQGAFSISDVLGVEQIWDYLLREKQPGWDLLRDYQLAPVALLYGPYARDYEGLHDRVISLIRTGNKSIVQALFDPHFRGRDSFRELLRKDIDAKVLAAALVVARQDPARLNIYAARTPQELSEDLELIWDPAAEARISGGWVYLEVPRRLLAKQGIPGYVWSRLGRRAVSDLSVVVLTSFGASTEHAETFKRGYDVLMQAVDAIESSANSKQREETNQKISPGERPQIAADASWTSSEQAVRFFQEISGLTEKARESEVYDAAPIIRLYKTLLAVSEPSLNAGDRPDVRLLTLRNARVVIDVPDDRADGPIRRFFHARAKVLTRKPAALEADRERAWRESISAWWLMHSARQLDLLD